MTAVAAAPESVSLRVGERLAAAVAALTASASSAVCSSISRTVGSVVRRLPLKVLRVLFRVVMWFSMLVMAWIIDVASLLVRGAARVVVARRMRDGKYMVTRLERERLSRMRGFDLR